MNFSLFPVRSCRKLHHISRYKKMAETGTIIQHMLRRTATNGCIRFYLAVSGSGPHGVDGRGPQYKHEGCFGVAVTDPFQLYQSYVLQRLIDKDEQQLRVMKEFQKLYYRVIGYRPPEELQVRISLLLKQIEVKYAEIDAKQQGISFSSMSRLFQKDPVVTKNELVAYLTDEEELKNIVAPTGLLVNGEVGSGKSMLMDIFAASLPYESKMRWHYNNFILWVFNQIHEIQNNRNLLSHMNGNKKYTMQNEFILFEIAQKMIKKNTILILDEFMLPDIALANIIKILFTYYFKLGGVLVATSNKLPEELYSNQFHKGSFDKFVGILHSRCLTIDMKSQIDYRCKFFESSTTASNLVIKLNNNNHDTDWDNLIEQRVLKFSPNSKDNYHGSITLKLYGRDIKIEKTYLNHQVCHLDYEYICQGLFSSADYITIASVFPIVILDNVPIMTTKMKNEARRFISLLDAIYEAKCQFFMRCEVDIDYLFFPDVFHSNNKALMEKLNLDMSNDGINRLSVQDEEMFAKTSIAMDNPYRPNVSTYDVGRNSKFNEVFDKSKKVDFKDIKVFIGEDEKFAYKRAVLRIKEMVASDNWRSSNRWVPVDSSMRPWEQSQKENNPPTKLKSKSNETSPIDEAKINEMKRSLREQYPRDIVHGTDISLQQFSETISPKIQNSNHFWKMGSWNKENGKRLKDTIAKTWLRTSISNDKEI